MVPRLTFSLMLSFPSPRRLIADPYLRKSALYFSGSMLVAFLNYLFHPVLAARLSLADFGDVQALFSLITQLSTVLGAFTLAAVHASVNCEEKGECTAVIALLQKSAFVMLGISFLGLVLFASSLTKALQFTSVTPFFAVAMLLVATSFYTIRVGYLQGQGRFVSVSFANVLVAGGRLTFAVLLVALGFRTFGAIAGVVLAQIIALCFVFFQTRKGLGSSTETKVTLPWPRIWKELRYVLLVGLTMAYVTILYTVDVLIVKRYFAPDIAGMYSGIATIAKITFFTTAPLITVLISSIRLHGDRAARTKAFLKGIGLVGLVGGGVLLLFILVPGFFTGLLMGPRYAAYASLLPWLGGTFFLVSLTNAAVSLGLALRLKRLLFVAAFGTLGLALLTLGRHASLDQIIQNGLLVASVSCVAAFACILPELRRV